jgi:hypothetical protein
MKLFQKKKKIKSADQPHEEILQELALKHLQSVDPEKVVINYRGTLIKPVFNKFVHDQAIQDMAKQGYPGDQKDACIHFTNWYVWHSLKEGARLQDIEFNDSTIDLFFYINLMDYHKILMAAHNSGYFNSIYN